MNRGFSLGTAVREYPPVKLRRGWDPMSPMTRTTSLPVSKDQIGNDIRIQSGQLISVRRTGDSAWVLGVPADAEADPDLELYIAQTDSAPEAYDVGAANTLVGLDCSGQFTVGLAFFIRPTTQNGYVYRKGTRITYCKSTETLVNAAGATISAAGYYRPAATGEVVVATVESDGPVSLRGGSNMSADNPNPTPILALGTDSTSLTQNAFVVWLKTTFTPAVTAIAGATTPVTLDGANITGSITTATVPGTQIAGKVPASALPVATASAVGAVKGSADAGKVAVDGTGTMSVNA